MKKEPKLLGVKGDSMRITRRADLMIQKELDGDELVAWPGQIRKALDDLTKKQRRFTLCLAMGLSLVASYRACYSIDQARTDESMYAEAYHTSQAPKVIQALALLNSWLDRSWLADVKEAKDYIVDRLYEESEWAGKSSERISAANSLARIHGLMVSKSETTIRHELAGSTQEQLISGLLDQLGISADQQLLLPQQQIAPTKGVSTHHTSLDTPVLCPHCGKDTRLIEG